jgi:precorrin-6Y C5,15-methyltransferase (decarboxylating)
MADPWLTIIGIGEDGLSGLSDASRKAIARARILFGGARHLDLVAAGPRGRLWPRPFSIAPVLALRGQPVVVLASGDPFWQGVGALLAEALSPGDWMSHPAPSSPAHAANLLGWRLEEVFCLALHAAPLSRLRPHLTVGARLMVTLRDGAAAAEVADYLMALGFGDSRLHLLERLGGPLQRIRATTAEGFDLTDAEAPALLAIEVEGGPGLPRSPGLPDDLFRSDGQITKSPIRALTLAALAPRPSAQLWDLGAGSGSISVEFCLAGGRAVAVELRPDRVANIRANAANFGVDHRLQVVEGAALGALATLPRPDAVFIGGGADAALLAAVWDLLPQGARLVINAVTLETEALLAEWHGEKGGDIFRFEIAQATPLGRMRGWSAARPVVQWSVAR